MSILSSITLQCRRCRSCDIGTQAASGRGTVWSFTINRQAISPGLEPPYVLAEVELEEHHDEHDDGDDDEHDDD